VQSQVLPEHWGELGGVNHLGATVEVKQGGKK